MCNSDIIRAFIVLLTLVSPGSVYAQGSAGTGTTSTGIGPQTGPVGPGIRSGGWTQQPGGATNNTRTDTNLSPAQKNAIPPPSVSGYRK
jgi:hypothetical protein